MAPNFKYYADGEEIQVIPVQIVDGLSTQAVILETVSGSLNALNAAVTLQIKGGSGVALTISAGTLAATVSYELSCDSGVNWTAAFSQGAGSGNSFNNAIFTNPNSVLVTRIVTFPGVTHVRARVSAYTSGSANALLSSSQSIDRQLWMYGKDINNGPVPLRGSTAGALASENWLNTKTVYSAVTTNFTPPATPTDMVTLTGSASKTIKILALTLFTTQTAAGTNTFYIVKRSTANSAGTSTTPTIVPHDSNNAAATAVMRQYSANPTLGNSLGNIRGARITTPAAAGLLDTSYIFDFTHSAFGQGIVLRGTGEVMALNFNGAALPAGLTVTAEITWLEE